MEQIEKARDSQLAREIEAALPRELTREQQLALVRAYVKDNFVDKGMPQLAIMNCRRRSRQRKSAWRRLLRFGLISSTMPRPEGPMWPTENPATQRSFAIAT